MSRGGDRPFVHEAVLGVALLLGLALGVAVVAALIATVLNLLVG